jgi:hypothetical protein
MDDLLKNILFRVGSSNARGIAGIKPSIDNQNRNYILHTTLYKLQMQIRVSGEIVSTLEKVQVYTVTFYKVIR